MPTIDRMRIKIAAHGDRRQAAREEMDTEMDVIEGLVPKALNAGMSKSEIARLAQISRVTLDRIVNS